MNLFTAIVTLVLLQADTEAGAPEKCGPGRDKPCKKTGDVCVIPDGGGEGDCKACDKKCNEGQVCILNVKDQEKPACLPCGCPTKGFEKNCSNPFNLPVCKGKACTKDTDCGTERTAACVKKLCKACFMKCKETETCTAENDDAKCKAKSTSSQAPSTAGGQSTTNNSTETTTKKTTAGGTTASTKPHSHNDAATTEWTLTLFGTMLMMAVYTNDQ